jgi:DIE2/ALG10 family
VTTRVAARVAALPVWSVPVTAWVVSRLLLLILMITAAAVFGEPTRGTDPAVPDALAFLGGWDTTWYLDVARDGYSTSTAFVGQIETDFAFFPVLPGIMMLALEMGLNPFVVALVVSHLAFLVALIAFNALTRERIGEHRANIATWALALFPPAFVASLAYTEGLVLMLVVGAALAASKRMYPLAGLACAAAAVSRPTGIIAVLLVGLIALRDPGAGRLRRMAMVALPAMIALGGFLAWMQVARGSWSLPFDAQAAWDRGDLVTGLVTQPPGEFAAVWGYISEFHVTAAWTAVARDLGFGVLYAVLLVKLWKSEGGLRSPWVVYSLAVLAVPLSSGSIASLARFGVLAFPLAWPAADWLMTHRRRIPWAIGAAVVVTVLMVAQLEVWSP